MAVLRGEVYDYSPVLPPRPRQSTKRLIISVNQLNEPDQAGSCVGLLIDDYDPGGLLTVPISDQGWWIHPSRIERVLLSRLGERLYVATADELDQIAVAMRAAYDL